MSSPPVESTANFGQYITNQYGILRRVFSHLPSGDVRRCANVCQAWGKVSKVTLSERRAIECFWFSETTSLYDDFCDAEITLTFSTSSKAENNEDDLASSSTEFYNFLSRYGVIALINDSPPLLRRNRVELPLTPKVFKQVGVRFPAWDGILMKTVTITNTVITTDDLETAINIPKEMHIKAVILIVYAVDDSGPWRDNLVRFLEIIKSREKECAIGGCRLDWSSDDPQDAEVTCIIFAGDPVQAASCVLDNHCRTEVDISARVEQLSKNITPVKNSVVLAFRCCDRKKVRRRYNYEPKQNVETWETNALKKSFPTVPVIGCYGVGELGADCPRLPTAKRPRLQDRGELGIEYAYSTILVYLGFK